MGRLDPAPQQEIAQIAGRLYAAMRNARPPLFNAGSLRGKLLTAALRDEGLRAAVFQFVDVLPCLQCAGALSGHFRASLHDRRLAGAWGRLLELGEHPGPGQPGP